MSIESKFPQVKAQFWNMGKVTYMPTTIKTKRLYAKIRAGKFDRIHITVLYGKRKASNGKMEMFYNDGIYENPKDALFALNAFLE